MAQQQLNMTATDPRLAIVDFEQILLSNSGEDAFDSAIKLLSAKLIGEYESSKDEESEFRLHSTPETTHEAIQGLYRKALARWPQLDSSSVDLGISPPHLVRSLRPLLGWRLRGSNLSWLDATLERLVARDAKGEMGQYFTPREVVRFCVEILNPSSQDVVIDPACGSGGFLFEATEHSNKVDGKSPTCLGIDFSSKSIRVAALLAAAADDSNITVSKANSLDGREYSIKSPPEWKDFLLQKSASHTPRAIGWGNWNRLGCDVLLTNPPFAGSIDESDLIEAYESQHNNSNSKALGREHLFLERAVDLLRPGGRLAIVVPQGILANSSATYLRVWLLSKCRVLAVVGLHPFAFLPYTGVKTAILFLQKPLAGECIPIAYPILFATSRACGKDSSGKAMGVSDYAPLSAAIRAYFSSEKHAWAQTQETSKHSPAEIEVVSSDEVFQTLRLDAEHYDPFARRLERKLATASTKKIRDVVEPNISRFKRKDHGEISYVDISSVDARTGLAFPEIIFAEDAPSRASYLIKPGDVLVSTVRPDRNVVAIATSSYDAPPVASNGFCVLRPKNVAPELLFAYCKSEAFKKILSMHATASMYPTVGDKDVGGVPFVLPDEQTQSEVIDLVRAGMEMIEEAQRKIELAIEMIDQSLND